MMRYFLSIFILVILGLAFNNCNKVAVSNLKDGGSSPGDESIQNIDNLIATCANAKALGKLRTVHLSGAFADPAKQCDWGINGNLSIMDKYIRARIEQSQTFQVSSGKSTICNIQMQSTQVSNFYYDDNVFMTLNGYILASTSNFSAHLPVSNGYYRYDWNSLINKAAQNDKSDSTPDKQYCAGRDQGLSTCQFPETETQGTAQIQIGEKVVQTILGMTDSSQFVLGLVTTGDNDTTDCQHVPINLNMDVDYIAE